jgi:hypothetical protein
MRVSKGIMGDSVSLFLNRKVPKVSRPRQIAISHRPDSRRKHWHAARLCASDRVPSRATHRKPPVGAPPQVAPALRIRTQGLHHTVVLWWAGGVLATVEGPTMTTVNNEERNTTLTMCNQSTRSLFTMSVAISVTGMQRSVGSDSETAEAWKI